jgi:hypothetical protein
VKGEKIASMRVPNAKAALSAKTIGSARATMKSLKSTKAATLKSAKANFAKVAL